MALTDLVPIPDGINVGPGGRRLLNAKQATMLALLGSPRADLTDACQPVATPALKALMVTDDVGPFRVTGLKPAVASLKRIMARIKEKKPDIHGALGSAGMLCARHVRGSTTAISNHSWGTAIDLKLGGVIDPYGDGKVQRGLTEIYPYFNEEEWFWGAAFSKEDGMHFEASDGLVRAWAAKGEFGDGPKPPRPNLLSLGDRGSEVRYVQEALNAAGAGLLADGIFGRETQAAVLRFQAGRDVSPTGVVDEATWSLLHALRAAQGMPVVPEAAAKA